MRLSRLVFGSFLVALAPACAAIWGFEDATLGPLADDSGTSSGGSSSSSGSIDGAPDVPDGSSPIPEGCEQRVADVENGLFVDAFGGEDTETCGESPTPCRTIGVALAHADNKRVLHLGLGEYGESVSIPQSLLGRAFRIEGRWERVGGEEWKPFCKDEPSSASVSATSDSAAVRVVREDPEPSDAGSEDTGDAALDAGDEDDAGAPTDLVLAYLTLSGRRAPIANESSYGVFARGTRVTLVGVTVVGGRGGDGQVGDPGNPGQGLSNSSDGTIGSPGGAVPQGRFTRDGWRPSDQPPSPEAGAGNPGRADGLCQGGNGGGAGKPGKAGGASVAAFLWDAELVLESRTGLASIGGGNGGNGGPGGIGAMGRQAVCTGGTGGTGSIGSPGPGGPSYCVVLGGTSTLVGQLGVTNCAPSPGGAGGNGGLGIAGEKGASVTVQ